DFSFGNCRAVVQLLAHARIEELLFRHRVSSQLRDDLVRQATSPVGAAWVSFGRSLLDLVEEFLRISVILDEDVDEVPSLVHARLRPGAARVRRMSLVDQWLPDPSPVETV